MTQSTTPVINPTATASLRASATHVDHLQVVLRGQTVLAHVEHRRAQQLQVQPNPIAPPRPLPKLG